MKDPYKTLAQEFLPDRIQYLLIGESPPCTPPNEEPRYFYNCNNSRNGEILLSSVSYAFLNEKFYVGSKDKRQFLEKLTKKGIFLLDATYEPINQIKEQKVRRSEIRGAYPWLKKDVQCLLLEAQAKIFLIHGNVVREIGQRLRGDFNNFTFYDIGFPRYYNDEKFKERIQAVIKG
jgi:hypothetical protein